MSQLEVEIWSDKIRQWKVLKNDPDWTSAKATPHAETCLPSPQLRDHGDFQLTFFLHFYSEFSKY